MEEYANKVFQVVCLLVFVAIALSLCILGCFKSLKITRSGEAEVEVTTNANQIEEINEEREVGNHRGHERALPEIPSTLVKMAMSADDEEEEDDSIYDIISRSKKVLPIICNQTVSLPSSSIQINTIKRKKQHPYEKVNGDGDSSICGLPSRDPLYAGLKDITAGIDADTKVKDISDPLVPSSEIFYVGSNNTESLPQFSYVPNPVLPPRNFPDFILQSSSVPSNHFSSIDPINSLAHHFISPHQDTQWSNIFTGQQGDSMSIDQLNATCSDDRRVPNYSSVTARESLNNLRKRGQLCDNQEEMYDTINYDAIKGTSRMLSTSTVLPLDHVYCTTGSDLYAEIATGQSSSRSSIYARVTDVSPQSNSNFSLTFHSINSSNTDCQIRTSNSSTSSNVQNVQSFQGSEFPIYSVVNKSGRPKTYQDFSYGDKCLPASSSLKKSCAAGISMLQCTSDTLPNVHGSESSKQDSETKCKSEHSYSKIVFNKRNINHKFSLESNNFEKGKHKASLYDCVDEDSLYESVPMDIEKRILRLPNHTKFKANEKIKLPWKDRCKKSNEDLRRDDSKKIKLTNGYFKDSDIFSNILNSNGLNITKSHTDAFSSKSSLIANCSSFPKFEWNRHSLSSDKNLPSKNTSFGRSRFYVISGILPEENNVSSDCNNLDMFSSSSYHAKNPPIREHIYELVKDATYIDDDDDGDDDGMILESDV